MKVIENGTVTNPKGYQGAVGAVILQSAVDFFFSFFQQHYGEILNAIPYDEYAASTFGKTTTVNIIINPIKIADNLQNFFFILISSLISFY